jgi:hypothetical protein
MIRHRSDPDGLWNWVVVAFLAVIGVMTLVWAALLFI